MDRAANPEANRWDLKVRLVLAVVGGALTAFIFSYLPETLPRALSVYAGKQSSVVAYQILSSFINPALPAMGFVLTVFVFLGILLIGSKAYGWLVLANGFVFTMYVIFAFEGGTIHAVISNGLALSGHATAVLDVSKIMEVFLIPPLLTVVKGVLLLRERPRLAAAR